MDIIYVTNIIVTVFKVIALSKGEGNVHRFV